MDISKVPELVAEIAVCRIDFGQKACLSSRWGAGISSVAGFDQRIDWFSLQNGDYMTLLPEEDGVIRSQVFPGLWLDVAMGWQYAASSVCAAIRYKL